MVCEAQNDGDDWTAYFVPMNKFHFGVKSVNLVRFVSLSYLLLMYWKSDSTGWEFMGKWDFSL